METTEVKTTQRRKDFIFNLFQNGMRDKKLLAVELKKAEEAGLIKQRSNTKSERNDFFYVKSVNWYLIQMAKSGKIDLQIKLRPRKPKTVTNEEAQQMVNSGEATIPAEAVATVDEVKAEAPQELQNNSVEAKEEIITL